MELRDYIRVLRKRWIAIVALTALGVALGALATLLMTPQYRASTFAYIQVQSGTSASELVQGSTFAQNQIQSYTQAVDQPKVLDEVVDELNLDESSAVLAESVQATAANDSLNIEIAVTRENPEEAAEIANAITASFTEVVAEITEDLVSVNVLRDATVPTVPESPDPLINLALGLLVGLALGLGAAILWEVLDTRVRGQRDVEAITKAPIIGGISYDPDAVKRPLIVQDDPHSPRAEAFRTLRTNLQFLDIESGPRSFVITSSIPAEGKTTTSANLAIALADAGARVVIVDADLRRPKIASYMGLEGAVGLTDVLIARAELADAVQPWGRGTLSVLPAGSVPPNPSELLGSRAMASVLRALEADFDVVLVDLPPLLPVTDGAIVSKLTRGALVVVAAGRTHKGEFSGAISALESVGAHVAGIIMTMLPTKGPDAYGHGRYGYGGYGGYASDVPVEEAAHGNAAASKRLSPDWDGSASKA